MNRITIFAGHYGSGKTNSAVAYAKYLKKESEKITIVDIDLVNPYYRTKDAENELSEMGIKVLSPVYANTNVETPTIPAEVMSAFHQKDQKFIFDVGGDDDGAKVLGRFFSEFSQENCDFWLVINTKRPLTFDAKSIIIYMKEIESASRLKFNGLVNATNLSNETTINDILESEKIIAEVEELTGIPKKHNFVLSSLIDGLPDELKKTSISVDLINIKYWE